MTIQEIIKNITIHYEWVIENLPKDKPLEFCEANFVNYGVCYFVEKKLGYSIYLTKFIKKFTHDKSFVCLTPSDVETFEEILLTLRTRHKRLLEMADYT